MSTEDSATLAQEARRLGVADRYHGFWGKEELVPEAVLRRAVQAMQGDGRPPPQQHLGLPPVHVLRAGSPSATTCTGGRLSAAGGGAWRRPMLSRAWASTSGATWRSSPQKEW